MSQTQHQIVIIGAGTGGITVAAQLLRKDKNLDIVIIDPAENHYYQPAWTLVGAGTYDYEKTIRPMQSVIPDGTKWIQEAVTRIDADNDKVYTSEGQEITYEYLIVAPGVQYDLDAIEGLAETLGKNGVCSNYTDSNYTWEVLSNFKGGNALFTQPATPIKCGGAPQKIMYLADDYLRKQGVRDNSKISFLTPGSVIFGVEPFKQTLMKVVDRKNIDLRFFHKIVKIDGPNKKAYFEITENLNEPEKLYYQKQDLGEQMTSKNVVEVPFDLLHLAPPQSAPDFVKESKLAHQDGPDKGWVNVNHFTLQHNEYPHVFALGDVAALPTAKTGAAVRKQAPVVAGNLIRLIKQEGGEMDAGYKGYSSCPLVTGYGKMVLAEFKYGNERDSDALLSTFVDTSKENWSMWILKKYGLPYMYWNMMLKGRA